MPTNTTNVGTGYLQTYLHKQVLKNFEPNLLFAKIGKEPLAPNGIGTVAWAKPSKLLQTSTQTLLTEGVTPSETAFSYTVYTATPEQYGLFVIITDLLLKMAPTKIVADASREVGKNLARVIDQLIQETIMTGTHVLYGGNKTARADLTATDVFTDELLKNAVTGLSSVDAPTFDGGYYLAVMHPFTKGDLQAPASAWIEFSKYSTPDKLFRGEIGALYGARVSISSNIQPFTSTVPVYPTLVLGEGAYGVTDWQSLEAFYKPLGSEGTGDPLNQRATVGAKVAFATTILQEDAMWRIESAATAIV